MEIYQICRDVFVKRFTHQDARASKMRSQLTHEVKEKKNTWKSIKYVGMFL